MLRHARRNRKGAQVRISRQASPLRPNRPKLLEALGLGGVQPRAGDHGCELEPLAG